MGAVDRCQQCGFVYDLATAPAAADAVTAGAGAIASALTSLDDVRTRCQTDVWSPLEYACHVRDVLLVQRERVLTARRAERPSFTPMGRDERVEHDGYAAQDPHDVARQLADAATLFANVLRRLSSTDLERTVIYNHPTRQERTLAWVAVHTVHEIRHHLDDISEQVDDR